MTEKKFPFYIALLVSTIGLVSTDLYLPSMPFIQEYFHSAKSSVQFSLTLFLLGLSFSQMIYGPLSDRYGRKPVVIVGLSIGFLGAILCLFTPSVAMLNAGRFIQGFGLGAGATIWRTILRDVYSGDDLARLGAWAALASSTSMGIAPTLGGYIQRLLGWRVVFLTLALYACATLYLVWTRLPETNKTLNLQALQKSTFFQSYRYLLSHPIFIGYSGSASLALAGFSAYFASSPFLFEQVLGLSAETYGLLAVIFAGGLAIGGLVNARLIPILGRHRLLVTGTVILFLAGLLMFILGLAGQLTVWAIMLPVSMYTFGCAFVLANSFAGAFYPFGHMAGFAGALYGCIQILGGSISSALISMIQEKNQIPLSIFFMVLGASAYLLQLIAFRASKKHE